MSKLPPRLQHLYDTKQYAALRSALEELAGDALARADWDAHDRIMQHLRAVQKLIVPLFALCFLFASCEPSEPSRGGDTAALNQPSDPATWSPVGHKYVSTDEDYPNREITFFSKDSFLWLRGEDERKVCYRLEYPTIYVWEDEHPWLKFVDTLTISRKSDLADESSCYKLVY